MWGYGIALATRRAKAKELITTLVGRSLDDALAEIKAAGLAVQLLEVDGVQHSANAQFNPDRLGLVVAKGTVTGAQLG